MDPSALKPLGSLSEAWRAEVKAPVRRATLALLALALAAAMLIARQGTGRARVVAAGLGAAAVALAIVFRAMERRRWEEPARVIRRLAGRVDPERAERAVRALSLLEHEGDPGTSRELARLHVARALDALPRDRILEGASRAAYTLGTAGLLLVLGAGILGVTRFYSILEGADVLVARPLLESGVAPVDIRWFVDLDVVARPPDYLHEDEREFPPYTRVAVARGTLLTIRGTPSHKGRRLALVGTPVGTGALADGSASKPHADLPQPSEVPFVDDGTGRLIARWPVAETVDLRVVARFGDVVIFDPDVTRVHSIPDLAPIVTLEGAPRRVTLATDGGDIPIRYEAIDDHGLREVHLVLRSGTREERRVLARLDGETRTDRGGHMLRATDSFLKKSHAPVEVVVEAKDNDPITGPKWGRSPAITVVPPEVGEPEARRIDGLRKLRNAVVDVLAWRLSNEPPSKPAERKAFLAEELRRGEESRELLEATLSSTYAGMRVPPRLQAMLRGHMRRVREATNAEAKGPTAKTHTALVRATERLVLVVDGIVRGLGQKDSRATAKQLADVADDLALGASQMQRAGDRERGTARADAAVTVLEGGGRSLLRLGSLGRDLGEIVGADLRRVARGRGQEDLVHAEIAARDLAARLRDPDPSFASHGRAGTRGGEGGGTGAASAAGDEGEGEDDAEQAFNMAAEELERLAQDHAEELGKVEQSLNLDLNDAEAKDLEEEAKKHAAAVREASKGLPSVGTGGDSWTNKAAAAHEHAEAMARALDQSSPSDAVKSGKSALEALEDAKRAAQRENSLGLFSAADVDPGIDKKLEQARQKLEPEVKWAEEKLSALRKQAAERKAGELSSDGEEEQKMAERARDLGDKGQEQQALPDPALEALGAAAASAREAANSLKKGDAEKALDEQREAQRQLEMAKEALGGESERGEGGGSDPADNSPLAAGHAAIPTAEEHKGPEEFRRRVMRGLGQAASAKQRDAVRRYADGLLR